ncbi:uncharacterized protein LOC107271067 isoform X2 [Cephus cinctus]|nr:uncharacterized protein LOC107271067 isoform X2 [Cephus cinctus]XP_015602144.1 uncharacterized protein LOC107271067 isoform X2 [Cephus cinctus]XP_015602145.1 uncharacterized protein LOC107271067 isoform X2 [Cephus cinctus]
MVMTACSYLALAGAAWIFLRLLQACFWLPRHLRKQNDVQKMLQDKVDGYERYMLECEEKDRAMGIDRNLENFCEGDEKSENDSNPNKWKERRECLEMLKRELNRVRDGGDINDWDYLLEEDKAENSANGTDVDNEENLGINVEDGKLEQGEDSHVDEKKEK